jgi:hypothetical protein
VLTAERGVNSPCTSRYDFFPNLGIQDHSDAATSLDEHYNVIALAVIAP